MHKSVVHIVVVQGKQMQKADGKREGGKGNRAGGTEWDNAHVYSDHFVKLCGLVNVRLQIIYIN